MRIVMNHLTRMNAPRICIAGIDEESERHVRPVTPPTDLITRDLLADRGGPLELGALVDLGRTTPAPSPPEVEDHRFATRELTCVRRLDPDEYLDLLIRTSEDDLEAIFGSALERHGWKYAVDVGKGDASLGVLRPRERVDVEVGHYGRLQVRFNDPRKPAFLTVNDLRFYEPDQRTLRRDVVEDVQDRLQRGIDVLLMVGLTREWKAPSDTEPRHWLQINGLCLMDRPLAGP